MTWRGAIELSKGIGLSVAAVAGVTGSYLCAAPGGAGPESRHPVTSSRSSKWRWPEGSPMRSRFAIASDVDVQLSVPAAGPLLVLHESSNWVALAVYLVTAVVVSELATRSRRLARKAVEAETLRQSDAAKTAVLQAVSHDLRSPLAANQAGRATASTVVCCRSNPSRSRGAASRRFGARCRRLERLVENLLDLSRIDAGPARAPSGAVDGEHPDRERDRPDPARMPNRVRVVSLAPEQVAWPTQVDGAPHRARTGQPPGERTRVLRRPPIESSCRVERDGGGLVLVRVRDRRHGGWPERSREDCQAVQAPRRRARSPGQRLGTCDRAWLRRGQRGPGYRLEPTEPGTGAAGVRRRAAQGRPGGRRWRVTGAGRKSSSSTTSRRFFAPSGRVCSGAGYDVVTERRPQPRPPVPPRCGRRAAVILDLVLPDGRGVDIVRSYDHSTSVPILVLSAVGDEREKVEALDAGADDYVTKPFGIDELLARLRALLRQCRSCVRSRGRAGRAGRRPGEAPGHFAVATRSPLRRTESSLGSCSVAERGQAADAPRHPACMCGARVAARSPTTSTSTSRSLRRKIGANPTRPRYLLTRQVAGYRLVWASLRSGLESCAGDSKPALKGRRGPRR